MESITVHELFGAGMSIKFHVWKDFITIIERAKV